MAKEYKITSLRLQDLEKELNYLKTGAQITYTITGSQEANPMEYKLSDDSPFGRAAVGKSEGDVFMVNAPAGSYEMKVIKVTREG